MTLYYCLCLIIHIQNVEAEDDDNHLESAESSFEPNVLTSKQLHSNIVLSHLLLILPMEVFLYEDILFLMLTSKSFSF